MIEVNVKAKKADPWDTPFLNIDQVEQAWNAGKWLMWFRQNEEGIWKPYDNMVQVAAFDREKIAQALAKITNPYRVRAHAVGGVALFRGVLVQSPFQEGVYNFKTYSAPSRKKLDDIIAELVASGHIIDSFPKQETRIIRSERSIRLYL